MGTFSKTPSRVFTIRVGDFIELRASTFVPKAKISKITRTKMVSERQYDWIIGGTVRMETRPVKTIFQQTHYIGGRVLGYTNPVKCRTYFGKYPTKDKIHELTKAHSTLALNPKWRAKHL